MVMNFASMNRVEYFFRVFSKNEPSLQSKHPLQRPTRVYIPGLTDKPWHETTDFEWTKRLEESYETIKAELLNLRFVEKNGFRPNREPQDFFPDYHGAYRTGKQWNLFYFFLHGKKFEYNCDLCPETTKIIESIPRITGTIHFSVLTARTHISPHCGAFNLVLRCQLPLVVPINCQLRIANETRTLVEGKPLIFDDTFRHEAWNNSESSRFVLVFEVYHPDLTDTEIQQFEYIRNRNPIVKQTLESWLNTIANAGKEYPAENLWHLPTDREKSSS